MVELIINVRFKLKNFITVNTLLMRCEGSVSKRTRNLCRCIRAEGTEGRSIGCLIPFSS